MAALNHGNIDNNPQRIVNLTPFIANYNWDDIKFPAGHKDYSAFEKNNSDIALNILFIPNNTKEIRQAYVSKHNKTRNIHANLLMITDGTGKNIQKFSKNLRSIFNKFINYKQKPMIPLPDNEKVLHDSQKLCFFYVKNIFLMIRITKKSISYCVKLEIIAILQVNKEVLLIANVI